MFLAGASALAAPVPLDPPAGAGALAPGLVAVEGGVVASWVEPVAGGGHGVRVARLAGRTWSTPQVVAEDADFVANWADTPMLGTGPDGALLVSWPRKSGSAKYAYDVQLSRSEDRGRTWRRLGPAHDDRTETEHGFVSMLTDGAGTLAIWLDGRQTANAGPMTLRAAPVTRTIGAASVLDERVCDCCGTAAAVTDAGPVVVYRDRTAEEIRDIAIVRRVKGAWTAPAIVHADDWKMPGCPVNGPAIAASGGSVAVAWFTGAQEQPRVHVAFSRDGGASFGAPIVVDGNGPLGRAAVVLDGPDQALVSWLARDSTDAVVRLRRVGASGSVGSPLDLARVPADRSAGFPRMVPDGDRLVVAWTEPGKPSRIRAAAVARSDLPATGGPATTPVLSAPVTGARTFPVLQGERPDGSSFDLASLRGQVVLLNYWATWCVPCRRELPALAALHRERSARGLQVVGVSIDDDADAWRAFLAAMPMPFVMMRRAGAIGTVPATHLYDRSGTRVWSRDGELDPADSDFRRALDRALAD